MTAQDQRWNQIVQLVGEMDDERIRFRVQGQSMLPTLHPGDEVVVERVSQNILHPGDLILIRDGGRFLLHRLLGIRHHQGQRLLLTSGDGLRHADPLIPEEAFMGRAVTVYRHGQPVPLARGRWQAWRHQARITFWAAARLVRSIWPRQAGHAIMLLLLALILALGGQTARASVTLVSFEAGWQENAIRVTWETASEVDNMGFYVLRSEEENPISYERVTELIPGEGDLAGAFYEWIDQDVTLGTTYHYKLEDVSASGGSTLWGPVTVESDAPPPTDTATATATATVPPRPTDTPPHTPSPTPTFTATPSPSPTFTGTPQPSATSTQTAPPTASPAGPQPTATTPPSATPQPQASAAPPPSATPPPDQPSPTPTTATPTPTTETQVDTTATHTPTPSASAALTATPLPSPTPTAVEVVMEESPPEPEAEIGTEPQVEETAKPAERRRNVALLIISVVILGGLLLVGLALVLYALYRWGYLRRG